MHNEVRHDLLTADARQLEGFYRGFIQYVTGTLMVITSARAVSRAWYLIPVSWRALKPLLMVFPAGTRRDGHYPDVMDTQKVGILVPKETKLC